MSTIHFVGGEKGGVGKSVFARVLSQLFIDRSLKFAALDADASHGALLRFYREFSQPVDLEQFDSADQIVDRALGAERQVVVDLPAQSLRPLRRWLDAADVVSYARETGVGITLWHVSDGGYDSVNHLEQSLQLLDPWVRIVVVRNHGRSRDFLQLDAIGDRISARGAESIDVWELDPKVMYKIDRLGSSLWSAVHATEGPYALSPMERRRARVWLERAYSAIESTQAWSRAQPGLTLARAGDALEANSSENGASVQTSAPRGS